MLKTIKLQLEVEIDLYTTNASFDVIEGGLAEELDKSTWEDGRYSFSLEMLGLGLNQHVKIAIGEKARKHMQAIYGDQMRQPSPGHLINVAYEEAEKYKNQTWVDANLETLKFKDLQVKDTP